MTLKYQSNLRMMIFARAHDTRGKLIRSQWTKYFKSKDVIWDRFVLTTYSTQSTCVSATKSTVVLPKYAINNYNILKSFQIDMMILNTTLYINLLFNRRPRDLNSESETSSRIFWWLTHDDNTGWHLSYSVLEQQINDVALLLNLKR